MQNVEADVATESGTELFARFEADPIFPVLEETLFSSLKPGDVIEITGESGVGKTELLYHFIAQSILPTSWNQLEKNESGTNVTFIDTDCHFDIFRLVTILELRVLRMFQKRKQKVCLSAKEIPTLVTERLKLLNIIKCYDNNEFMLSLCLLEKTLQLCAKHILMIDSLSALYYMNKLRFMNQLKTLEEHQMRIVNILRKLSNTRSTIIIATKQALINKDENFCSDNDMLGRSWRNFISCQLELKHKFTKQNLSKNVLSLTKITEKVNVSKTCIITDSGISFPSCNLR